MSDPKTIGRYQVIKPIGSGGMGTVYLAEDPLLKRRVAIKVVKVSGQARELAMVRFRREAEISAQLNHPNVVTVFDVGVEESLGPFLAMEYIEGKSLAKHIKDKSLDLETSGRVLIQAMRALRAAHRRAIVHRDVKPDNILLSEEGRAKLMDFGIARSLGHMSVAPAQLRALDLDLELEENPLPLEESPDYVATLAMRLTVTGDFLGSPAYAPPEVLKGGEGTPASDRYSFAATAFELLTGRLPHPGNGLTDIIVHTLQDPVAIPPDMPPNLAAVFRRALAADPDDRYTTLPEFLEELIDALPGPAHLRAKLFALLGQEDDGTGLAPLPRARGLDQAPLEAARAASEARARQTQTLKIDLAEDPVASYLQTHRHEGGGDAKQEVDWIRLLKWALVILLLIETFWLLSPALAQLRSAF